MVPLNGAAPPPLDIDLRETAANATLYRAARYEGFDTGQWPRRISMPTKRP